MIKKQHIKDDCVIVDIGINKIDANNDKGYLLVGDVDYQITASIHSNKPREERDLYPLYQKQGGTDTLEDFNLKWESGEVKTGNVRELREFKEKLNSLK